MSDFDPRHGGAAQPITTYGADVLARPCREVTSFTKQLQALVTNMFATMYASQGVGVAANQVGVGRRIFVIDCPDSEGERVIGHVVNPVYRALDETLVEGSEGCLSVPGPRATFSRPAVAEVTGFDVYGDPVRFEATGYAARCLQHETDHLDGTLYIDRISEVERARVLAELEGMRVEAPASPFGGAR
ncbi:peptide deformylase [Nocardioides currus]|uniref:Peptide deformylase n=1 Tax=Nocardioides currus TaxID=2133958 RepID=A0A2R7Z0D1_9ACTN|nr:peptide deformylase [Nocardioides currus]PUA82077.1 peptide deformylase [Nocardioides currus]